MSSAFSSGCIGGKCGARCLADRAVDNLRIVNPCGECPPRGRSAGSGDGEGCEKADVVQFALPSCRSSIAGLALPFAPSGGKGAGGDMGEKPTSPERRQSPTTARHGKKRAGAQPGKRGLWPRTPPPARPERPEAAPPPEKAAGLAGAPSGGTSAGGPALGPGRARRRGRGSTHGRRRGTLGPHAAPPDGSGLPGSRLAEAADREEPGTPRSGRGGRRARGQRRESRRGGHGPQAGPPA